MMVLPKTCGVCLVPLSVTGEAGTKSPPVMNAAVEVKCQGIVWSEALQAMIVCSVTPGVT